MSGNVWEWCSSQYQPYPYAADGREDLAGTNDRVVRGGSFYFRGIARAASRNNAHPDLRSRSVGFRVVCRPPSAEG
ncbi:MAG: SUMF1/EgtB/PvdO family nonheme iron enzyme [Anaerolineae bacterium]|nr:SUMF1/EgtB/PvdO family nonheme iron enzyme [Anaerolineae bacterium]